MPSRPGPARWTWCAGVSRPLGHVVGTEVKHSLGLRGANLQAAFYAQHRNFAQCFMFFELLACVHNDAHPFKLRRFQDSGGFGIAKRARQGAYVDHGVGAPVT